MVDSASTDSPLEAASGSVAPHATDAFELLGNETRLAIMLALWDAHEPHSAGDALTFSELRSRVGIQDSGQFNYHLGKLEDRFVQKRDDGYRLRREGLLLIQSIIAGTGIEEPALEPTPIASNCALCGAQTAITYGNVFVYQVCTECEGEDGGPDHPAGTLVAWTFEPTGLTDRTAEEVFTASTVKNLARIAMRFENICPECSGPVDWSLELCEEHDTRDGVCPHCGREKVALVRETCRVCKSAGWGSPGIKVLLHPAVVSFFYDQGIEVGFTGDTDFDAIVQTLALVDEFEEELLSADPPRLRISISHGGDEIALTLDGEMTVIDVIEND